MGAERAQGPGGGGTHTEARRGRLWTACGQQKQSNDAGNNQRNPQDANYWAPLTRKRHTTPHSAQPKHINDWTPQTRTRHQQPQHTNYWAPRTRKRHQQEHRPQRPSECSAPTQHAKGRTGDCPGPRKEATTRRNVTRGAPRALWDVPLHHHRVLPAQVNCLRASSCLVLVTGRHLSSCRPLTGHVSFCAFVLTASCAHVQ